MADQEFFKRYGGSAPENYEKFFVPTIGRPLATDLVARAALHPGERVLDVACGTGVVARLAKEKIGQSGTVTGLDLNPGMLAVARSVTPLEMGIAWHEASAESMPLPDASFDVTFCQMSLQFVPDKVTALREMHRVLVPGGRLLANVPGPAPGVFTVMDEALGKHIGPEAAAFVRAVFALHDPGIIKGLLSEAGFREVTAKSFTKTLRLPPPREFLWQYVHSTPLTAAVAAAGEPKRTALEREATEKLQAFVQDGALILEQHLVVATGRK